MKEELKKNNLIVQLSFEFAVSVIALCEQLEKERKWSLANQILRATLSIGANVKEAQNAESKPDFIHKMKIAAKESEEVEFYFEVCNAAPQLPNVGELLQKVQSINRVLNKIIGTSKRIQ